MVNGHKIEFSLSSQGNIQLLVDDYPFNQNQKMQTKTYFRCNQTKALR